MPITDCDEVYNYWEPLHFLLYGYGMQTWEYAHEYALRTYAYLTPMKLVAQILGSLSFDTLSPVAAMLSDFPVHSHKVAVFLCLRAFLGALTALTELHFVYSLRLRQHVGGDLALLTALLLLTQTGLSHAAAAYLPSSTWMAVYMLASGLFLQKKRKAFIVVAVIATLTTGWPFGAVMLVPMGVAILLEDRKRFIETLAFTAFTTLLVQGATMWIDLQNYGKWVSPTLNIFLYNAGAGGDELYGVEPLSYYMKNLVLNLNLMAPLGMLGCTLVLLSRSFPAKVSVIVSPAILWFAITFPRPHKEERFMFPVYPLLCLCAVLCFDIVVRGVLSTFQKEYVQNVVRCVRAFLLTGVIVISLSRSLALQKYYTAPLGVFAELAAQSPDPALVCTCGEWYRYPSSFYLPEGMRLGFLKSSFVGQLPQPFSKHGSSVEGQEVLQSFNDRNREEESRYSDDANCTWIVDFDEGQCAHGLTREHVLSLPFLNADKTPTLHRIVYIPYMHEYSKASYSSFTLWKVVE